MSSHARVSNLHLRLCILATVVVVSFAAMPRALAVPAFARKYGTSCVTCHTVFPKLNPFGEAFRRNGFRFPGVDSDNIQKKQVTLSQEAYKKLFPRALWPSKLAASVPIAVGFVGQATIHPDKHSAAANADNNSVFSLQDLVGEAQIWAAGSFTDSTTFFGELAFSEDGVEVEHGSVQFGDLFGPKHMFNLWVGKYMPWYTSFGMHSSYLADMALPMVMVASLYGAQDETWAFAMAPAGLELNGVIGGRFNYSIGLNAGAHADVRNSDNLYAHIGYKFGGVRLDGEENSTVVNAKRPWEETALTIDAFGYIADSHFVDASDTTVHSRAYLFGGAIRAQWKSLELNSSTWYETHHHASDTRGRVDAIVHYDELSYVIFPWLVPAARFEYVHLAPEGGQTASHIKVMAGVDALIFANLKLNLVATIEAAKGSPTAMGWMSVGDIAPAPGATGKAEIESLTLGMQYAF